MDGCAPAVLNSPRSSTDVETLQARFCAADFVLDAVLCGGLIGRGGGWYGAEIVREIILLFLFLFEGIGIVIWRC